MSDEQWRAEFARKLKRKMDIEGVDQRRLARYTGLSESSISCYLSGTRSPKVYALTLIAKALNATLYELIPPIR